MPTHPEPSIVISANSDAPAGLRAVTDEYWAYDGVDDISGLPRWVHRVRDIDSEAWSGSAHYAAAAGGTAELVGCRCRTCAGPLTLSSRQTVADALAGRFVQCRSCNGSINTQAARVLDPATIAGADMRREAKEQRRAAAAQRAEEDRQRELLAADHARRRRAAIEEQYAIVDTDVETAVFKAAFVARVGALAVLIASSTQDGLIRGIGLYDGSVAPTGDVAYEQLLVSALSAHLLRVHPTSPEDAFGFTEQDTLGERWAPQRAHWYASGTGSLPDRFAALGDALRTSLEPALLSVDDVRHLTELAETIVAEEAIRYFSFIVRSHNLPDPMSEHAEQVRTIVRRGAKQFAIGHLYKMAWAAAHEAAAAYQRNTRMPQADAVTYAVRHFERVMQRYVDGEWNLGAPYREERQRLPLSAATTIVFSTLLNLNPMTADLNDVAAAATAATPSPTSTCTHPAVDRHELIEWVRTNADHLDDDLFRQSIAHIADEPPEPCSPGCRMGSVANAATAFGVVFDRLVSRFGAANTAVVVAEAALLANAVDDRGDAALSAIVTHVRAAIADPMSNASM